MKAAIKDAFHIGYRHIDTAVNYDTHKIVVEAFNESGLTRESVFITTKVMTRSDIPKIVEFAKQIGYIDAVLIHHPQVFGKTIATFAEGFLFLWKQLSQLVDAGQIRFLGVSNFYVNALSLTLKIIADNNLVPCTFLQLEINLVDQNHQYVEFCKKKGIIVVAHTPLGGQANQYIEKELTSIINTLQTKGIKVNSKQLQLIGIMARGIITIPSSRKAEHIKSNFESLSIMAKMSVNDLSMIIDELKPFDNHYPLTSSSQDDKEYDSILEDTNNKEVCDHEDTCSTFHGIIPKDPSYIVEELGVNPLSSLSNFKMTNDSSPYPGLTKPPLIPKPVTIISKSINVKPLGRLPTVTRHSNISPPVILSPIKPPVIKFN